MQAMGENLGAAIPAFAKHLSQAASAVPDPTPLKDSPAQEGTYFDLCGVWMISYPVALGRWLHNLMLPLVLLRPPAGVRRRQMAKGAGLCLLSLLCGLALPAGVGALRAAISGIFLVFIQLHCHSDASVTSAFLLHLATQQQDMNSDAWFWCCRVC